MRKLLLIFLFASAPGLANQTPCPLNCMVLSYSSTVPVVSAQQFYSDTMRPYGCTTNPILFEGGSFRFSVLNGGWTRLSVVNVANAQVVHEMEYFGEVGARASL